ncbi:scavenger receptor cysteine-rich domain-containing protein DMBT1-like [Diadema antillarum]|uniref:scavenger receptor cysteine-rich domain-containing protein DMBT1-like n=1 Tax=Diadema antillarum TaxID=105358 RepID=UPI003A88BDDD
MSGFKNAVGQWQYVPSTRQPSVFRIRLVGGSNVREGRVELYYNGTWGTVCDDRWSLAEAEVACRMLGYSGAEEAHDRAEFGEGEGPIIMDNVYCLGNEESLEDCLHNGFLTHDCYHNEDAGVTCSGTDVAEIEVEVRLADGRSGREGRVEVNYNGTWCTVCDDGWDYRDARVVCRMLGFPDAAMALSGAHFGPGFGTILLDDVSCYGGEANLLSCWHRGTYQHDCDHSEDASVVCARKVRLSRVNSYYQGVVEIYFDGTWNSICDDDWDIIDAGVVCRMLGFLGAEEAISLERLEGTLGRILLDHIQCDPEDEDILDCSHSGLFGHNCARRKIAGVVCSQEVRDISRMHSSRIGIAEIELDVRLADGSSDREGRVEINYNGTWSTVCDDGWDYRAASVVCRMLGFPDAAMALSGAHFGPGSGTILLDDVSCYGDEANLLICWNSGLYQNDCDHSEDASVICARRVRLVGSTSDYQGTVELYYDGEWNSVCDDGWDLVDAGVVCRMLGFPGVEEAPDLAQFGNGSGQILLDEVQCVEGNEDIFECVHNGMFIHDCTHSEDAGVVCSQEDHFVDGDLQLLPSLRQSQWTRPYAGVVLVFSGSSSSWGRFCADTWSQENSDVACKQLGFHGASEGTSPDDIDSDASLWTSYISDVQCGGWESSLRECRHTWSQDGNNITCHSNELAKIACHDELIRGLPEEHWEGDGEMQMEIPNCLSDGASYEGALLVQYAESWGAVCADSWSKANADVACRQLDFGGANAYPAGNIDLDIGSRRIMLNNIECDGWETTLVDCRHSGLGNPDNHCQSEEIAVVSCYVPGQKDLNRLYKDILLYTLPVIFVGIFILSVYKIVRVHGRYAASQQTGTSSREHGPDMQHDLTVSSSISQHSHQPTPEPKVITVAPRQLPSSLSLVSEEALEVRSYTSEQSGATG